MNERARWAIYAAILAALRTGHPKRVDVARALEALLPNYRQEAGSTPCSE